MKFGANSNLNYTKVSSTPPKKQHQDSAAGHLHGQV